MSSTRTAKPGSPFRQERFASSREFDRGLKANLVARRGELLDMRADREMLWWLQRESHSEGGLAALVRELCERNASAISVPSLRDCPKNAKLSGDQVWRAMREINPEEAPFSSRYNKERFVANYDTGNDPKPTLEDIRIHHRCHLERTLPDLIQTACLDPETWLANDHPSGFPGLRDALLRLMQERIEESRRRSLVTSVGEPIHELLRFAWKTKQTVLIIGESGHGKTVAVKNWCDQNPGVSRYFQVPSAGDDISFFREIGKSLGIGISLQAKAQQLRLRIEAVLQSRRLLLCFDEAHYMWPQTGHREALPYRVNWLMTALMNFDVPLAIIATPQFLGHQRIMEDRQLWNGTQLRRRIARSLTLPSVLPKADMKAVARHLLPEGTARDVEILVTAADVSEKRLSAIGSIVTHARYIAAEDGRDQVTPGDIALAVREKNISERDLIESLQSAAPKPKRHGRRAAVPQPAPDHDPAAEETASGRRETRPAGNPEFSPSSTRRGLVPAGD
jgi:hypothetical protein